MPAKDVTQVSAMKMKSRAIGSGLIRQASAMIVASRTHAAKARPPARPASRRRRIQESDEEDDDPLAIVVLDSPRYSHEKR